MIDALDRRLHDAEAALAAALERVAVLQGAFAIAGPIALADFASHPFVLDEEERAKVAQIKAAMKGGE